MPDMSLPGAHFESLLDDLKFRAETEVEEARKHSLWAEAYSDAARKLERAMNEEAAKAKPSPTSESRNG